MDAGRSGAGSVHGDRRRSNRLGGRGPRHRVRPRHLRAHFDGASRLSAIAARHPALLDVAGAGERLSSGIGPAVFCVGNRIPEEGPRRRHIDATNGASAQKPKRRERNPLVFDAEKLARLITYCAQDTRCCRAVWTHPRLVHLTPSERQLQIIDAVINRRGVHFNRRFVENARDLSMRERTALNNKLSESTDGAVSSVDQVQRRLAYISKHGHNLASVNRRSIAAALAANPDEAIRKILELRRDGARASTRKFRRILAWANDDDRL